MPTADDSLSLEPMRAEHVERLTRLMKRAFDEDSIRFKGKPGGPEGYDDGSFLRKWGLESGSESYAVSYMERLAGAAIIWRCANGENFLGCLFLDVELEGRGIGAALWRRIESLYPEAKLWRTETANHSLRNHYFYVAKCGFSIVGIDKPDQTGFANYHMEKRIARE